jgi:hypothetical protein
MRQKLAVIITIVIVVGVLIAMNGVAYVGKEEQQDSELAPNRSTYHSGATGTRALYDFLSESGYKVMRWREAPDKLLGSNGQKVQTFVIIGRTPLAIDENQAQILRLWVKRGGRLIIVDRSPEINMLPPSGEWAITTELQNFSSLSVDPASPEEMTKNVKALRPVQPTLLTRDVEFVMPSRLASIIGLFAANGEKPKVTEKKEPELQTGNDPEEQASPLPRPTVDSERLGQKAATPASPAPVVQLGDAQGALLLDYPHGEGRIVLLSDPYVFANGGIRLKDNLQLAINMLTSSGGLIAFDEYHQGRGATRNAIVSYFSGTPVLAICGQIVLLVLLVLWTRGRRFARPLPLPQVDRRSSLEFVASMAELQQQARAFDLAIENIYSRTRRVLARYAGVEYNSSRSEIAARIASRSALHAHQLEILMRQCEEAINGEPISEGQSIQLVKRLREVEAALGLRMRSREVRQAAQNI